MDKSEIFLKFLYEGRMWVSLLLPVLLAYKIVPKGYVIKPEDKKP
jgi:hypothetical protein